MNEEQREAMRDMVAEYKAVLEKIRSKIPSLISIGLSPLQVHVNNVADLPTGPFHEPVIRQLDGINYYKFEISVTVDDVKFYCLVKGVD